MQVSRQVRVILVVLAVLLVAVVTWLLARSPETSKLAAFKAELRAKGEKLTLAELGYPLPVESGNALNRLLASINRLRAVKLEPSRFELMQLSSAGRALVAWRAPSPPRGIAGTNQMNWEQIEDEFDLVSSAIAQIRAALTNPPARFFNDPSQAFDGPRPPFIELRKAAQWLAGDAVVAMQAKQRERACADVVALAQLAQVHRDDLTLVSQMIRTAIAGLGLAATWEVMQSSDLTEDDLAAMQAAWESVHLLDALERALTGERCFGELGFHLARERDPDFHWPFNPNPRRTMGDVLQESFVQPYWRMHIDSDELLMLRHYQNSLEAIRRLQREMSWPRARRDVDAAAAELSRELGHPLKRFHYLLSAVIIPNTQRAAGTVVRNEVLRRLTVTALALERHHLRHGEYPAALAALAPDLLASVPRDLMTAQPLAYRLNAGGDFTLYSSGEDGRDDGGDPSTTGSTNRLELWTGRDFVWPKAAE